MRTFDSHGIATLHRSRHESPSIGSSYGSARRTLPNSRLWSSPAMTTTSSVSCIPRPRVVGAGAWARMALEDDPTLHAHHLLRDLPLPLAARPGAGGRSPRRKPSRRPRVSSCSCATRGSTRPPRPTPSLKKRTLTNLYNARPTWLDNAHRKLDAAVFAAYGWPARLSDEEILARLLALNLARAGGK